MTDFGDTKHESVFDALTLQGTALQVDFSFFFFFFTPTPFSIYFYKLCQLCQDFNRTRNLSEYCLT